MPEKCCLNCSYWKEYHPSPGYIDGMICTKREEHTSPYDSCVNCKTLIETNSLNMSGGISQHQRNSRLKTYNNWLKNR